MNNTRRAITGIETAIVLVAFIIVSSAFSFSILNVGFTISDTMESTVINGMTETLTGFTSDPGIWGYFNGTAMGDPDRICLKQVVIYLKLSSGHESIPISDDRLLITYTNLRTHSIIYSSNHVNGSIVSIRTIIGDNDSLLEPSEKVQILIDFTKIESKNTKPLINNRLELYSKSYEDFRIEIRPMIGATLILERRIPVVTAPVMELI